MRNIRIALAALLCLWAVPVVAWTHGSGPNVFTVTCGGVDDSAAINSAIDSAIALMNANKPGAVYIPTGICNYVTPHATMTRPISFFGDGAWKTVILIDKALSGDVFSFSDVWQGGAQGTNTYAYMSRAGVHFEGMTIIGDRSTSNTQNLFMFYDRADFVYMRDIEVWYMKGRCFYNGVLLNQTASYMRESYFDNVRFNRCGDTGVPAFELSDVGGGDGTNEVTFVNLRVVAAYGPSVIIRNNGSVAIRELSFYRLRIEPQAAVAADELTIGDGTFSGTIDDIVFTDLHLIGVAAGQAAFKTIAPNSAAGNNIFNIVVNKGYIPNGAGKGIDIEAGRGLSLDFFQIATTDTNITVGPTSQGIGIINFGTALWTNTNSLTTAIDATAVSKVSFGNPVVGDTAVVKGTMYSGAGSPETVITAAVGSLYTRTDGGAGTTLYVKESGAGNTGWVAK